VDYFFWDQLIKSEIVDNNINESVINNKSYHNEIVDYINSIGNLLGFNSNVKRNIKNSGKIADSIWELKVGNKKIRYVFEVQDSGKIDSLIVSLINASKDVSVQAVIAVSDEAQLNKIKKRCHNDDFHGKLSFWDITEVEKAYKDLSSAMEIINNVIYNY